MLPPLPRRGGRAYASLLLAHPCQPSPVGSPGRPAHRPFRGLLGVHSRCGLHTRTVTVCRDRYPKASDISSPPCLLRLLPAGAFRRVGLAPTGKRRLVTAHTHSGPMSARKDRPRRPAAVDCANRWLTVHVELVDVCYWMATSVGRRFVFGKRVPAGRKWPAADSYAPVTPEPGDGRRILPKAIWDGPNGDTLRKLGFLPDDPANLSLTPQRMRAMEEAAVDEMNAMVAKVNAHIPNVTVAPWAVIPWSIWKDQNAHFLMRLKFLPCSPWNNMLLAADAKSSEFLGLPVHPRAALSGLHENLTRMIDELRSDACDELERNLAAISRGDLSILDRYERFKNDQFQKLFALTRHLQHHVYGEVVCARHDELFGVGLSKVTG